MRRPARHRVCRSAHLRFFYRPDTQVGIYFVSSSTRHWLDNSGVARGQEYEGAKDALWWAAMTYVAAALSALVMVLYLVMQYNRSR